MSLLTPMMRTSPLTAWFSDAQRVQGMLDFEAALARAQVECGLVPQAALNPIIESCRHENIDFAALGQAAASAGNLAIPLVKQLTARVKQRDDAAARYVHWGATSQDAIDTGFILQLRGALAETDSLLQQLLDALAHQAARYQDTVMPGRTWMQHALPVTFGLKLAAPSIPLKRRRRGSLARWRKLSTCSFRTRRGTASVTGCWRWGHGTRASAARWVNSPMIFLC